LLTSSTIVKRALRPDMTPSNSSDLTRSRLEYLATSFHPITYSKATAVARKEVAYDSDRSSPSIIVLDEPPQSGKRRRDSSKSRVETPPAGFQANRGRLTLPGGSGGPREGRIAASRNEPFSVIIDSFEVVIADIYAVILVYHRRLSVRVSMLSHLKKSPVAISKTHEPACCQVRKTGSYRMPKTQSANTSTANGTEDRLGMQRRGQEPRSRL
jgi:hypothetical protein